MQTPPRFDFSTSATPPASSGGGQQATGNNPPYFPPPPYRDDALVIAESGNGRSGIGRIVPVIITLAAFGGLGLLGWFAYQEGRKPVSEELLPVIKADDEDFKREPENPGGEEIPYMDRQVYNSYSGQDKVAEMPKAAIPENPAEQPIDRDYLKQFAGSGEDEMPPAEGTAPKEEVVMFGNGQQGEAVGDAAVAAPGNNANADLAAPDAAMPSAVAPIVDAPTPNTGGVITAPMAQETVSAPPVVKPVTQPATKPATQVLKPVKTPQPTAKKTPAKPKATATAPVSAGDMRVQLGAFRSEAEAMAAWSKMKSKFGSSLSGLSMMTERADIPGKGVLFRLQAGPVKSRDAGRVLCKKLSEAGQGCFVVQ